MIIGAHNPDSSRSVADLLRSRRGAVTDGLALLAAWVEFGLLLGLLASFLLRGSRK